MLALATSSKNRTKISEKSHVFWTADFKRILASFWEGFGKPKPLKINNNSCLKQWFFPTLNLCRFLAIDFESPWGSKNSRKSLRTVFGARSECVWTCFTNSAAILERSLQVFDGFCLIMGGILMLVLPGQGLLTILVGLMLSDYPGKFKLEKRIIKTNLVLKTINWYRTKSNIPPLIFK